MAKLELSYTSAGNVKYVAAMEKFGNSSKD